MLIEETLISFLFFTILLLVEVFYLYFSPVIIIAPGSRHGHKNSLKTGDCNSDQMVKGHLYNVAARLTGCRKKVHIVVTVMHLEDKEYISETADMEALFFPNIFFF